LQFLLPHLLPQAHPHFLFFLFQDKGLTLPEKIAELRKYED
jgi:hypothetical protein